MASPGAITHNALDVKVAHSQIPTKFVVSVPDAQLRDLKERLSRTRWPDQLEGVGWEYGTELAYTKELADYWEHNFDWKKAEAMMNAFEHYKLQLNGIDLHFIHERSEDPNAIPLLFSHGWPGSFVEAFKIIRKLTHPDKGSAGSNSQGFHVVVPSLPGYGFSAAPTKPGFSITDVASTFDALMVALGYTSYVAQGGDWGSAVASALASRHSNHCKSIHLNFVQYGIVRPKFTNPWHIAMLLNAKLPVLNWFPVTISRAEMAYLQRFQDFIKYEAAYAFIQGTKPQTLGYGLTDSPVGLLAWIVEKFRSWTDCKGDVESRLSKDEMLMNVSIYWFNANITSSTRLYYESNGPRASNAFMPSGPITVPTAVANFPEELWHVPRAWVAAQYNLKQWSMLPSGGHFAAMEEPEALVADMRQFFARYH